MRSPLAHSMQAGVQTALPDDLPVMLGNQVKLRGCEAAFMDTMDKPVLVASGAIHVPERVAGNGFHHRVIGLLVGGWKYPSRAASLIARINRWKKSEGCSRQAEKME